MTSEDRYSNAKKLLLQFEQTRVKEKALLKRLGKVLPEETIKTPQIGEWSLSQADSNPLEQTENQEAHKAKSRRAKTSLAAPVSIRPPKVLLSSSGGGEPKTSFPSGTVTTDLKDILRSKFKSPKRPLPPLTDDEDIGDPQFLPLEFFDDSTYEEYPLEELLKTPSAVSKYQELDGTSYWAKCTVLSYDPDTQLFLIEWEGTGKRKKVARFNLRFERESETKFEKRIQAARRSAALHEAALKLESRIAQMPSESLPELSPENFDLIHQKVSVSSAPPSLLFQLDEEIRADFKTINNRLEFEHTLLHNPLIPDRQQFLKLLPQPPKTPEFGLVALPSPSFEQCRDLIHENHLLANPNYQNGLFTIWGFLQDSEEMSLLSGGFPGILTLGDFVAKQYAHLDSVARQFKGSIQDTLEGVISSTISDHISTMKPKDRAQYSHMVTLTTRMLHTTLLSIVEVSLDKYLSLFEKHTVEYAVAERPDPQFTVSLSLEEGVLKLTPPPAEFESQLTSLLSALQTAVADLPIIRSVLFEVDTSSVSFTDCIEMILQRRETLDTTLLTLFGRLEEFLSERRSLEPALRLDPETFPNTFDPEGTRSLDDYRKELASLSQVAHAVQHETAAEYSLGIFKVSCQSFKEEAAERVSKLSQGLLQRVREAAVDTLQSLKSEFDNIADRLRQVPTTPEQLAESKAFLEKVYDTAKDRARQMASAEQKFAFLEEFKFPVSNEDFHLKIETQQQPSRVSGLMDETERMNQVERIRMIRELRGNQRKLETETLSLTEMLTGVAAKYTDLEMTVEAADQVNEMKQRLDSLREQQETYSQHERLFEFEQGSNRILGKLVEEFTPIYDLWNLAAEWLSVSAGWLDTPFPQVRADAVNQFVTTAVKKLTRLRKSLVNHRQLIDKVLEPLTKQVEEFRSRLPLVTKLRHPGVKTKHWEQISEVVGFKVSSSMEMTLQGLLDLNLDRWFDAISEITAVAAQEYSLEASLDQMDAELQQKKFMVSPYRDSLILTEIEDLAGTIDDQVVTTQTLLTSPFIGPVKGRAEGRLQTLRSAAQTLEAWVICQKEWLYLRPIFEGTSIQQKLAREAADWKLVDSRWSAVMTATQAHPEFNTVMHRDSLLQTLLQCNDILESITRGLNAYLETKRLAFPRFFFLSNDELISILSHTKDFDRMQESIPKLFEYIQRIDVNSDYEISAIKDATGEVVLLKGIIDGDTPEVEDWLNALEEEMKVSIRDYISLALSSRKPKAAWIAEFPAQAVTIATQVNWTSQVTTALRSQKLRGLKLLLGKLGENLDELATLVRSPLSSQTRQTLSTLIINEVHNRDVVNYLVSDEVTSPDTFSWEKQLRYYWDDGITVQSINNVFDYSYEYAGNSSRLVITPLTDRCYQTLLAAFRAGLSGAPSGPAGTGKTETVRDCAKALGRPCVVYNCSEEVTPEQMSQFFAGLASAGVWSCFDEFNRINIEVLSVIAQQVRTIQNAINSSVETFILDERTLKINPNAAICITMNPGYAGRTELPDNLKALFRPVAMMVPDFVFISEILLFGGGFAKASALSVRLVALFDLCRKQLSNADHYDWGMRAMKAILSTAAEGKRTRGDEDEAVLLVEVIKGTTMPRLVSDDVALFEGIVKDVFPEVNQGQSTDAKLVDNLKKILKAEGHKPTNNLLEKCVQLRATTKVRHGIMLVGGPMGGKSVSWRALAKAVDADTVSVNPKAVTISELYGAFNPVTSEWTDGVLSMLIREGSLGEGDAQREKWIIVDGPVDSLWIESMNSLLDDNRVLCLPNNERIQLGFKVKMVFEVDSLAEASPATVSRCGMVYYDPCNLRWETLADSWSTRHNSDVTSHLRSLMAHYLPTCIKFLENDGKLGFPVKSNYVVSSLLKLIDTFLQTLRPAVNSEDDKLNHALFTSPFTVPPDNGVPFLTGDDAIVALERALLFSIVWSFGVALADESRDTFDLFFRELTEKHQTRAPFPPKGTVYDYYADFNRNSWTNWVDQSARPIVEDCDVESMFIPVPEAVGPLFVSRLLLSSSNHILLHGPETSKTLIFKTLFDKIIDKSVYDCYTLPLSSITQPSSLSRFITQNSHKRSGTYGPLTGHHLAFMLDNIGGIKPELFGAQPPLELIRQLFDYGGWYSTAPVEFQTATGYSIAATAGTGSIIPGRLARHFSIVHVPKYDKATVNTIVLGLLTASLGQSLVRDQLPAVATASAELLYKCQTAMLPVPSKLHYVFNMRSVVRIIKGLCLCDSVTVETLPSLWRHEVNREFGDRLSTPEDRSWFTKETSETVSKVFRVQTSDNERYTTLISGKYIPCSPENLLTASGALLDEHNRESQTQLDITLFTEAADHIASISRSLSLSRGHSLLVGVKSSGRRSLARLAMHACSLEPYEIFITRTYSVVDWREDLKKLFKETGVSDVPMALLISDSQLIHPQMLEDLSLILSLGTLPSLFERDELDAIKAEIVQTTMDPQPLALFNQRVSRNLRIVFIMSPFSQGFKDSMLSFPSIRNHCTIEWFMPWSTNALESIAASTLQEKALVPIVVRLHKTVETAASTYLRETKRFYAVTPSRYFQLLQTLNQTLTFKTRENLDKAKAYESGVTQLNSTRELIQTLSEQLSRDIPILNATKEEVKALLAEQHIREAEVSETREAVEAQRVTAEAARSTAAAARDVSQSRLAEAQPILDEADNAVRLLDKDSLSNIKRLHAPNPGMKETVEAVCVLFGRAPRKVDGATPGQKEDDYWPEVVSLLADSNFVKNVQNFNIPSLPRETLNKLKKYVPPAGAQRNEKRRVAQSSFQAIGALYDWVCACYDYWFVYQEILPLKQAADEAEKTLKVAESNLREASEKLDKVEKELKTLQEGTAAMQAREKELASNVAKTQSRLSRAQKIMEGLGGETVRWSAAAKKYREASKYITGNAVLTAGSLTYLGGFTPAFRTALLDRWRLILRNEKLEFDEGFGITRELGNEATIREWVSKGLPNDSCSIENAIMVFSLPSGTVPLFIDPQLAGNKWLRGTLGERLVVLRFEQSDFPQRLKSCVSFGVPALIEDVPLGLDPVIEPLLTRDFTIVDGAKRVTIAGESVAISDTFKLFMSTKHPNPKFSPEVISMVSLINFTATIDGLSDLMANNLLEVQREDLDRKRLQLMEAGIENTRSLKRVEEEILEIVAEAGSGILDDDVAIETLARAQKTAATIEQQIAASQVTERQIAQFRETHKPVADRAALLYSCAADFSAVDPMYQFSLRWFVALFRKAVGGAESREGMMKETARAFFESISMSLFARHKLLFSLLMSIRIAHAEGKVSSKELAFMVAPTLGKSKSKVDFISDDIWQTLEGLVSVHKNFENILDNIEEWRAFAESESPETDPLKGFTDFQKFLLVRVFHLHRVREAIRVYVASVLGPEFVSPPTLDLPAIFKDSDPTTPIVFIITAGIDPQDEVISVAASMDLERYLKPFSLGRGRGPAAEALILDAAEKGFWVLLQNCHLSLSWMPRLETLISNLDPEKVHQRFRLCLVTMSTPEFPIGVLYQSTKLVYEIPKGMRENVIRVYGTFNADEYEGFSEVERRLTFKLAGFHAIVLERLQFGPAGWNVPYEFNPSDFAIARRHLRTLLNGESGNPQEALTYVVGELDYGGRVTDRWDRRLLMCLLRKVFPDGTLGDRYPIPGTNLGLSDLIKSVEKWPHQTLGIDVGLAANASTLSARRQAIELFGQLVDVQPSLSAPSEDISEDAFTANLVERLLESVPKEITKVRSNGETITTVLTHEVALYNRLIVIVRETLEEVLKGLKGLVVVDDRLERIQRRLLANRVPEKWLEEGFPSILSLRAWMRDLSARVQFIDEWVRIGSPDVVWLGGFFHPEEYLTAVLQVYARKHRVPFDTLGWMTTPYEGSVTSPPEEGVYIKGLALEGAKWDSEEGGLIECAERDLQGTLPIMLLRPTTKKDTYDPDETFECPVYRTQSRGAGAMGLPNYIISLYLPAGKMGPEHWIQRSVAAFITTE